MTGDLDMDDNDIILNDYVRIRMESNKLVGLYVPSVPEWADLKIDELFLRAMTSLASVFRIKPIADAKDKSIKFFGHDLNGAWAEVELLRIANETTGGEKSQVTIYKCGNITMLPTKHLLCAGVANVIGSLAAPFNHAYIDAMSLYGGVVNYASDFECDLATKGLILKDRTTGTRYRLYIDGGVLGIDAL
jgi:hypothetical protein